MVRQWDGTKSTNSVLEDEKNNYRHQVVSRIGARWKLTIAVTVLTGELSDYVHIHRDPTYMRLFRISVALRRTISWRSAVVRTEVTRSKTINTERVGHQS